MATSFIISPRALGSSNDLFKARNSTLQQTPVIDKRAIAENQTRKNLLRHPRGFKSEDEEKVQKALDHMRQYGTSLRVTAALFQCSFQKLWRRSKGRGSLLNCGKNNYLLDCDQEEAVLEILERYQSIGTPLRYGLLREVANRILKEASSPSTAPDKILVVGRDWPRNFVRRHADQISLIKAKYPDVNHSSSEENGSTCLSHTTEGQGELVNLQEDEMVADWAPATISKPIDASFDQCIYQFQI